MNHLALLLAVFFCILAAYRAQSDSGIQLFLDDGALPTGIDSSSSCGKALQAAIACNSTLMIARNSYLDEADTQAICTTSCYASLRSYRNAVASACDSSVVLQGEDITYPATFVADGLVYDYNVTCLKDSCVLPLRFSRSSYML